MEQGPFGGMSIKNSNRVGSRATSISQGMYFDLIFTSIFEAFGLFIQQQQVTHYQRWNDKQILPRNCGSY